MPYDNAPYDPSRQPGADQYAPFVNYWQRMAEGLHGGPSMQPQDIHGLQAAVSRYPGAVRNVFMENLQAAARAAAQRAEQASVGLETPAYERGAEPLEEALKIAGTPKQAVGRAAFGYPAPIAEAITSAIPSPGMLQSGVGLFEPETLQLLQTFFRFMGRR